MEDFISSIAILLVIVVVVIIIVVSVELGDYLIDNGVKDIVSVIWNGKGA